MTTLQDDEIQMLKALTQLNPQLVVEKGNTIKSITESGDVAAAFKIKDKFKQEFFVYDLLQMISALDLFKDPKLTIDGNMLVISSKGQEMRLILGDRRSLRERNTWTMIYGSDGVVLDSDTKFVLEERVLKHVLRSATTVNASVVQFIKDTDGQLVVKTFDAANPDTSNSSIDTGLSPDGAKEFTLTFRVSTLNSLVPQTYNVVFDQNRATFEGVTTPIKYWLIAIKKDSSWTT